MNDLKASILAKLTASNWVIQDAEEKASLPPDYVARYAWVPEEIMSVLRELSSAAAPDDKLWLVTGGIVRETAGCAFAGDAFERISREASVGDDKELKRIKDFWDTHMCIAMCVRSGYSFYALSKASLGIVEGCEPDFEDATPFADSFAAFIDTIRDSE